MAKDRLSGKLAVILHADVAGSTQLVQQDEQLAHERIQDAFRRFSDTIGKYHGRVQELRGDALLAEFERASDAVTAALSFQSDHHDYLEKSKGDIQPKIRVGIALGEVIIADSTVTGSGVVLAQRVEQIAEPGGLCITSAIDEALPNRMPFSIESLGEQTLKGFDESVRVYRVQLNKGESVPPPQQKSHRRVTPKNWWQRVEIAAVVVLIAVGIGYWSKSSLPQEEPASIERMAFPLPDKPSIAVLPFTNMSDDPKQEYFVDGMTEDLITDLSQLSGLFVIARNSVFTYKDKPTKVSQVAEELGVRYVLEGSVRRAGNQVRINAQLIDATTGGHLWAKRYDGSLEDIFALQDDVTQKIVAALAVELTVDDLALRDRGDAVNTAAYDDFLQGWAYYKLGRPEDLARGITHFEEAIRLDPEYTQAHAALAALYWEIYSNDWAPGLGILSFEVEDGWEEHLELAMKAPNSLARSLNSRVLGSLGRYEEAVIEAEKAVALGGNDATAYAGLAAALIRAGSPAEGADLIRKAMRLDPHYPPNYLITLGQAQFDMENYRAAAATFERAIKRNIDNELSWIYLAATYAYLNRIDEGDAAIEAANDLRSRMGLGGSLSLEGGGASGYSPFSGEIEFSRFGDKLARERVRAGLSRLPMMTWQYLITVHLVQEPGMTQWEVEGASEIDLATAKAFHSQGVVFIDLNDTGVWKQEHIPGSVNLPLFRNPADSIKPKFNKAVLGQIVDETEEFVFVGTIREDSPMVAIAAAIATRLGFQHVNYFWGGNSAWKEAGYSVQQSK
jgi:adenylate cyclase